MNVIKNSALWYIIFWCLETLLPIFIDNPINSVIFWSLMLSSLYLAYRVNMLYTDKVFFNKLNLLVLLFVVYGVLYYLFGPVYIEPASGYPLNKLSYTTAVLKSLLPIYAFYYFTRKHKLKAKIVAWLLPLFLIIAAIFYNDQMQKAMLRHLMSEDVTNNAGYYVMSLLPVTLFWFKKPILQYSAMMFIGILLIFAMKRGAILIGGLMTAFYFYHTFKDIGSKYRYYLIFFGLFLLLGLYYFISHYMMDNLYFLSRIEDTLEGDSSSRDDLYNEFWKHIINTNIVQQLLGGGANYTLHVSYNYAHNDWLEIGVNQGLLGVGIFATFWLGLYKRFKCNTLIVNYNVMLGMALIGIFVKTLFSMSYSDMTFFTTLCIGYCLAVNDMEIPEI